MFHQGQLPLVCCRRLLGLLLGRLGCFLLRLLRNCWVGLSSVKPGLAPSMFVDILIFSLLYRVFGVPDWREKHVCDSMIFFVLVRRVCFLFFGCKRLLGLLLGRLRRLLFRLLSGCFVGPVACFFSLLSGLRLCHPLLRLLSRCWMGLVA